MIDFKQVLRKCRFWADLHEPGWLENLKSGAPCRVGATGDFALLLQHRWNPADIFVQLITKIDESGTHGNSPHMIMAGYTARLNQWNRFDLKWRKALRKARLEYFHAKEHWRHPFTVKAVKISDDNLLFGFVAKLSEADYKNYYRNDPQWGGKAQPDSMYGLCFRYCMSFVLQQALLEMPNKDFLLNFVVEDGHPNAGAPTEIVRMLKRKNIPEVSEFLGTAIPGDKKKVPGLQAADGLAFGAWHMEHEELGPNHIGDVGPSLPVAELKGKSTLKAPVFRCDINPRELEVFKGGYFAHIDFRKEFGKRKRFIEKLKNPVSEVETSTPEQSA